MSSVTVRGLLPGEAQAAIGLLLFKPLGLPGKRVFELHGRVGEDEEGPAHLLEGGPVGKKSVCFASSTASPRTRTSV